MNEEELREEGDLRATLDMWEHMEEEQRLMQLRFLLNQSFQKGKLEENKRIQKIIYSVINRIMEEERSIQNGCILFELKQLQKEINSQTEQNSDKEVAQPYSKSDTTTKGFILSDEQFQKEVDFAKKEIGGMK